MDRGTLVHELVLGGNRTVRLPDLICDPETGEPIEFPGKRKADPHTTKPLVDFKTNAAKDLRDHYLGKGKIPILSHEYDVCSEIADRIVAAWCEHFPPITDFALEERLQWEYRGVLCEGTPDALLAPLNVDVKTTKTLGERGSVARNAVAMGWDIQVAAYTSAIETLYPEHAGRVRWAWLVAEMDFPNEIRVFEPEASMLELGRLRWNRAVDQWRALLERGWSVPWPSPVEGLDAPDYMIAAEGMEA